MKIKLLLFVIWSLISLGQVQASWFSSGPKISTDPADKGHIFRASRGHFSEDTPENRAFIESAAESPMYKVGRNNFGCDIYLRTMPNGIQAWAEVSEGKITNGGCNRFPKQWVPDDSYRGGHFITPKFTEYNPGDARFRGALTINNLVARNGFLSPLSPSHWGTRAVVKGVEGQYGKIIGLIDPLQKKGTHQLLLPLEEVSKEEALQILREVAQGIYVYGAVPIFSLHFNRSMNQYPILFPHYRKTLTGEAIAMLDYWMKSAVNGRYFDPDFIYSWEANQSASRRDLIQNSHDFHEYFDGLGIPYRSFFDILEELREGSDVRMIDRGKLDGSFRITAFQHHIWKRGDSISFQPGMKIEHSMDCDQGRCPGFDLAKAASKQMCLELERTLPQIPYLKRYFEILHLANFFSYYCQTMKESGLIPLLDRNLQKDQVACRGCPNLYPPVPISTKDMVEIKLVDFLKYVEATMSIELKELVKMDPRQGGDVFHASMATYLEEYNQDLLEVSIAVFEHCKELYSKTQSNYDQFFQSIGTKGDINLPETRRSFFYRIDRLIQGLEGQERREMQVLKKEASEWFEDPCAYVFKNSGVKFNCSNGNFFFINHFQSDDIQFAGGCSFPIHLDMCAEENPNLSQTANQTIVISFAEMEVEEWEDPREVATGYLFPPLPSYPMKDSILTLLSAINEDDTTLFDQKKGELWMWEWNFCDPMGRFLVHHAAKAKTDHFLSHMISKWAKMDQVDRKGWTPLHYAAAYGSIDCIRCLVAHQKDLLERKGNDGETALFVAAEYGQKEALSTLLELGANPNCKIHLDLSALMWSILSKKEDLAMILLNCPKVDPLCKSTQGETAIELAVQSRCPVVLGWLLDHLGVEVNRYHKGMTPLHLAIVLGWKEGVELLLSHPSVDPELLTSDGRSCRALAEAPKR